MPVELEPRYPISINDVELVSIQYTDHLDSGESLTGTPTVVEVTTSDLTLANKAVNSATYVDSIVGNTVAIGAAVQFTVTTTTAATYKIRVTVSTDASPARTFQRDIILDVI